MSQQVKVWDVPTRLFHWTLVGLFCAMWYCAEQGGEWLQYHIYCGVALASLLVFRLIWGVIGSQTARFSSFVRGPKAILRYLKGELPEREAPGHNPLGGWMVVAMLLALAAQVLTGLFAADVDSYLYDGPLAKHIDSGLAESATGAHKLLFNGLLGLVALHIAAIVVYRVVKKQNLVGPMLTGYKKMAGEKPSLRFAHGALALAALLLSAGGLYFALLR
ncbi:cytochrome b/b6 domain-containing protein [Chromobacterium vaccinii]|nr:cytochrome b/b6 domain-containing protein [Chromobacterium vaccinii]MCD4483774.1 cytochrome b/b6 domain-containing protein [Chromobacterium vaccinii]MCD4501871.1 cytochrome b/b6 domain-containing protein [Chromobacterium vaccinii]QND84375.1 Cytochrome b [Chromobacterium vaccinii]QND89606.1 Cytochrome b [Chromobacterium vaccinii]